MAQVLFRIVVTDFGSRLLLLDNSIVDWHIRRMSSSTLLTVNRLC